jgi:parallel beta-helix repeat protein
MRFTCKIRGMRVRAGRWVKIVVPLVSGLILITALLWLAEAQARQVTEDLTMGRSALVLYVSTRGQDVDNNCQESQLPCQTIQHAMRVAEAGDYIHVAGGTYTGSMTDPDTLVGITATVIISKPISSLLGGYSADFSSRDIHANETIISAAKSPGAYVVALVDTNVRFGGFTLTGASGAYSGGGFKYPGGALRVFGGSPTIEDNLITHNQAFRRGGGIYVGRDATPAIVNNLIISNSVITVEGDSSNAGGGIYIASGPTLIRNNQIMSNTAEIEGGGIYVGWNVPASIISNTVAYNQLLDASFSRGAGIYTNGNTATVLIHANRISHNTLTGGFEGSGLFISSPAIIDGNAIEENFAPGGRSALCIMEVSQPVTVTNNIIADNTSIGVRLIENQDTRLFNNTIVGNNFRGVQVLFPQETPNEAIFNLRNNIIASNGECGVFVENPGYQVIDYNDVVAQRYQYCGFPDLQAHNISADPRFVQLSVDNYHLSPTSPAINQGDPNYSPILDYDDIRRAQYYNVDMGALEFVYYRTFIPAAMKVPAEYSNP